MQLRYMKGNIVCVRGSTETRSSRRPSMKMRCHWKEMGTISLFSRCSEAVYLTYWPNTSRFAAARSPEIGFRSWEMFWPTCVSWDHWMGGMRATADSWQTKKQLWPGSVNWSEENVQNKNRVPARSWDYCKQSALICTFLPHNYRKYKSVF